MNCKHCGYTLGDDAAFCPSCGREVRLVADYQEFGQLFSDDGTISADEPQVKKKPIPQKSDDISRQIKRQREEKKRKKQKQMQMLIGTLLIIAVAGIVIGYNAHKRYKEEHSFSYQLSRAESEFSNGKYDTAYEAIQKAIELEPNAAEAWLLKGEILYAQKEYEMAESVLKKVIGLYPDNQAAYGMLVRVYETLHTTEKIADLFAGCTDTSIREKYTAYICDVPMVNPEGGNFTDYVAVSISAEADAQIYYTLDGSTPGKESMLYTQPIELSEGTTRLKAIAINAKQIESDIVDFTYSVLYPVPETPKIAPSSGTFTEGMDTSIQVVVPEDCQVYYAFDQKPTEKSGTLYKGAVDMPTGEHTFYAIAVNSYGKSSYAASETYINQEEPAAVTESQSEGE